MASGMSDGMGQAENAFASLFSVLRTGHEPSP